MSKEKAPAYQHYPKDILSDINYQMMTWSERGMYRHLIDICWLETTIPDDPVLICRILQIPDEKTFEQSTWPLLARCFRKSEQFPSQLVHPRLELERRKQEKWREKCARGGRNSAHKVKHYKDKSEEHGSCHLLASKPQVKVNSSVCCLQSSSSGNTTHTTRPPADFVLPDGELQKLKSEKPGIDWELQLERFRLHLFQQPQEDWVLTWRRWCLTARPTGMRVVGGNGKSAVSGVKKADLYVGANGEDGSSGDDDPAEWSEAKWQMFEAVNGPEATEALRDEVFGSGEHRSG